MQQKQMEESRKATKELKAKTGQAPSEAAKKDYMKWRREQIKAHEQQRQQHHTIIEQQALLRKQEHEKRQLMLASRKGKKGKIMRSKGARRR